MSLYTWVSFQIGKQVPVRCRGFTALPVDEGSNETVAPDAAPKKIVEQIQTAIAFPMVFIFSPEGSFEFFGDARIAMEGFYPITASISWSFPSEKTGATAPSIFF